jgi:ribosomal protein S6
LKTYEIVMILDSRRIDDSGDKMIATVTAEIEGRGGKIMDTVNMGRRSFAHPIGKIKAGHYLDFIVELGPTQIEPYIASYELNDTVLRVAVMSHDDKAAKYRERLKSGKTAPAIKL